MMKPWRCQICGETYLGDEAPDRCPYCGAEGDNLGSAPLYLDYGVVDMCEQSRKDCFHALELELDNVAFYEKCAAAADNQISEAIFKRLGKHEGEHAELLEDMLGEEGEDQPEVNIPDNDAERFQEAHDHELRAINFYLEVARRAPEPRMKQVFRALSDIESEHLETSNIYQ